MNWSWKIGSIVIDVSPVRHIISAYAGSKWVRALKAINEASQMVRITSCLIGGKVIAKSEKMNGFYLDILIDEQKTIILNISDKKPSGFCEGSCVIVRSGTHAEIAYDAVDYNNYSEVIDTLSGLNYLAVRCRVYSAKNAKKENVDGYAYDEMQISTVAVEKNVANYINATMTTVETAHVLSYNWIKCDEEVSEAIANLTIASTGVDINQLRLRDIQMNDATITVAEMRKDLGEVLNRAYYYNEMVEVAKREKPFALVVSYNRKPAVEGIERLAGSVHMDSNRLVELLQAIPKDELLALLNADADADGTQSDGGVADAHAEGTQADGGVADAHVPQSELEDCV